MKTRHLLTISALAATFCFAQETAPQATATPVAEASATQAEVTAAAEVQPAETSPAAPSCKESLDAIKSSLPGNAITAKQTLSEAYGIENQMDAIKAKDPKSKELPRLESNCLQLAEIAKTQGETQALKNHTAENREKRIAEGQAIASVLEQIANARSGKMSNLAAELEAEKARLAKTSRDAKRLQAETLAQEMALLAAKQREEKLQKRLDEERAKAEARQKEALNKLNELQSKMIQVSQDARGIILSMSDILFEINKADLRPDLKNSLAKVAGILSVYQQFNVSIEGNTDNTGSEDYNMKLSQQRADNVMKFLMEQGIEAERLSAKGLGMTMPIADNNTKEGRQKNRRVDLVIQDKALQGGQPTADQPAK